MAVSPLSRPAQQQPMVKNSAAAPVVYFDGVPVYGVLAGIVELELTARVLTPKSDGSVNCDMAAIAHLRCSGAAAACLRDALDKAIDMMTAQQTQAPDSTH